jgi:hypothetical protein
VDSDQFEQPQWADKGFLLAITPHHGRGLFRWKKEYFFLSASYETQRCCDGIEPVRPQVGNLGIFCTKMLEAARVVGQILL